MPTEKSFRLPDELVDRLADAATKHDCSQTDLVRSLLDEGLKSWSFPGIVYRPGPTGRRAAIAVGPDVWEVVSTLRHVAGSGEAKITNAAEMLSLHERWIRLAISFYTAHPDEIDERIAANEAAAEEVRERAQRRERLLA